MKKNKLDYREPAKAKYKVDRGYGQAELREAIAKAHRRIVEKVPFVTYSKNARKSK